MTKLLLSSSALALVLAVPALASAQAAPNGSCPPGSWFCAAPSEAPPPPAAQPVQPVQPGLQQLPDPDDQPAPPPPPRRRPTVTYQPAPNYPPGQPPVVVYQPPPPTMLNRPESPPPYEYAPPPPRRNNNPPWMRRNEWGLNLHLEGAMIGSGYEHNAGMGGAGFGLRFKPNPYFGIESDLDFVGGHGYAGDQRHETGLTFNALMFLNPRSKAQVYLLGGFGWAWASSQNDPNDTSGSPPYNSSSSCGTSGNACSYSYFGAQAGIGLELRLTRVLAFNADLRGFVRARTDQLAQSQPEFTNPATGQTTNTSGGGLLMGGMTLYF
jgi:hypothetical protein